MELAFIGFDPTLSGRDDRIRRQLEKLGAVIQLACVGGFLALVDPHSLSHIRSWPEVRVAGGVHMLRASPGATRRGRHDDIRGPRPRPEGSH